MYELFAHVQMGILKRALKRELLYCWCVIVFGEKGRLGTENGDMLRTNRINGGLTGCVED